MKKYFLLSTLLLAAFALQAQNLSKTMTFEGQNRSYRIYIPASYDSAQPVPLLLAMHGLGDNATNFQATGFNQIADTANFIVVYPNALPDPLLGSSGWNAGVNPLNNTNDVGFLNVLLDSILQQYAIDTNRIYSTGFSLGGFMTYRLACEIGDRLAAVASVAGTLPTSSIANCHSGKTMPVLHLHGTNDQTIPYNFGTIFVVVSNLGADSTTRYWANHNGCDLPATHDSLPDTKNDGLTFEKFTYSGCGNASEVVLIKANGMAHAWPSNNNDISASKEIWNFFSKHQKSTPEDTTGTGIAERIGYFNIYPNPANSQIFVTSGFSGKISVMMTDLAGKVVFRDDAADAAFSLSIEDLTAGIYLFTLASENGALTKKVMVKRN